MWRAEATEVAQAASKWKQRALLLQAQVWRGAWETEVAQAASKWKQCALLLQAQGRCVCGGAVTSEGHVTHL